jgi:hypothetical protein
MNCQDFEKLALALARNSLLDATAREQGLIHVGGCESCAARLAEERALLARMRAVVEEMAGEGPPARVETTLLAAFRAQTGAMAPARTRHWSNWKLAAVAAGILILISMMAVFWRSASPNKSQGEERAVAPETSPTSPKPQEPTVVHDRRDRMAVEQPKNEPKRARRRPSVNRSDGAEVVTEFFPLREGEDLTALDSLQVVRIELPASALDEVGLPVDPEMADEPVKADVVLGQDGLARAIRFVR